jgi:hypothetical protein
MYISLARNIDATHFGTVMGIALDEFSRNNSVLQNMLAVIHIPKKRVQGRHTLFYACVDNGPILGRQHSRDHIKGKNAVDRVFVGINRECDTEIEKLPFGVTRAPA